MSDAPVENPEDKDLQDHTFGQKMAEKTERAEAGDVEGAGREPETEHHAGGKA